MKNSIILFLHILVSCKSMGFCDYKGIEDYIDSFTPTTDTRKVVRFFSDLRNSIAQEGYDVSLLSEIFKKLIEDIIK